MNRFWCRFNHGLANTSHLEEAAFICVDQHFLKASLLNCTSNHTRVFALHQAFQSLKQVDMHLIVDKSLTELNNKQAESTLEAHLLHVDLLFLVAPDRAQVADYHTDVLAHF